MSDNGFRIHRRAQVAINELQPEEGEQVAVALRSLPHTSPSQWPAGRARVFPGDKSLYLVRLNPSLRAILRVAEGQPFDVLDVVRRETLDGFAKAAAGAGG